MALPFSSKLAENTNRSILAGRVGHEWRKVSRQCGSLRPLPALKL